MVGLKAKKTCAPNHGPGDLRSGVKKQRSKPLFSSSYGGGDYPRRSMYLLVATWAATGSLYHDLGSYIMVLGPSGSEGSAAGELAISLQDAAEDSKAWLRCSRGHINHSQYFG